MKRFALLFCLFPLLLLAGDKPEPKKPEAKKQAAHGRGYKPLHPARKQALARENHARHGNPVKMHRAFGQAPPPAFDCRAKGWCVPTWDQASCGSCYLVSTVRQMTCAFVKAGYGKPDGSFALAAQYGMDCHDFGGCNGGNGTEVVDWARKNQWYAEKYVTLDGKTVNDYPAYEADSNRCRVPSTAKKWQIADWGFINSDGHFNVDDMKAAMNAYGVLNVSLDAGGQFSDASSTITSMGRSIDHEICAVAYDDSKDGGCVLLSNQWGTSWGDGGYQWCTYKACANIEGWFWVSAAPLPPPPSVTVPNVIGQSVEAATATLQAAYLIASVQGATTGTISSQSPAAGVTAPSGSTVIISVGPPPPPPAVVIWGGTFNRDWPKGKPFQLPIDTKKGDKIQILRPATKEESSADDSPFTLDPMPSPKEKKPCGGC